jgi:hypothetical protein
MKVSIDAALHNGWNRMATILFRPFDMIKWLIIGFASFLASLGQGGGFNFNFPSGQSFSDNTGGSAQAIESWFMENMIAIILVGMGICLVIFALALLIIWLSSRGRFVFLSSILNNKAEIRAPWVRYGHLGDRLFIFRLLFGIATFLMILAVLGGGILLLFPYFKSETFNAAFFIILMSLIMLFVVLVFCALTIKVVLMDFVVPVMLKRDASVIPAFRIFYNELCKGHIWDFTIFYLLKFAMGIAAGVIVLIGTCLTCCTAALPYVSSVVFLPIAVFIEGFTLSFLAQFGEEWDLFTWKLDAEAVPARRPPADEHQSSQMTREEQPAPSPEISENKPETE